MKVLPYVLSLFCLWPMILESQPRATAAPPNIVFIMADDLGWGELGCYGQKIIKTPNIDRLASEGMRFTQCYSGSPVCASSRCVLMTGKHTGHAYIRSNSEVQPEGQKPIPDEEVTLAELLKKQEYATGAMGKWGLGYPGSEGDPNNQGFDLFFGYNCQRHAHNHYPRYLWRNDQHVILEGNSRELTGKHYSQDLFIEEALAFVREHRDRPFFLYLPFTIPHLSIQAPEESLSDYRDRIPEEDYEHARYLRHPFPRAGYAAMVSHMDSGVGEILDLLAELELSDNTIVFFTSDNGPTFGRLGGADSDFFQSSGPFRGRKGSVYEGGIRVPMIVRWPSSIGAGTVSEHVCAFQDIMPTAMDLIEASESTPSNIDGLSFAPELTGDAEQANHDFLYMEFPSYGGQQMVRMENWKAVRKDIFRGNLEIELYDLAHDIGEQHDVSADHPNIVAQIGEIMSGSRTPSSEFPFRGLDE